MKRILLTAAVLMIAAAGFLSAQSEADASYIKAMTQNDPCEKVRMLKSYITTYGGKGSKYENFAYAYLCLTPCSAKPTTESIQYGEKALTLPGLDDLTKIQVLITLSGFYVETSQHLDKAKSYAGQVISLAKANKEDDPTASQWNKMIGAGYFLQGQAMEKNKDAAGAAEAYINSYNILKDPKIMGQIKKLAKSLYDSKEFAEAEKVFRTLYNQSKDAEIALILGQTLYKNNKPEEALSLFKEAYAKKRTPDLAYNIGIILAKKSSQEATNYLIEASLLYPDRSPQSQQALGMAQSLFFSNCSDSKYNDVIKQIQDKNKKIEELTKSFNAKFVGKNEEDLTDAEKSEMKRIMAEIEAQKQEIQKLQSSSAEMTAKWAKRMEDVKIKLGIY